MYVLVSFTEKQIFAEYMKTSKHCRFISMGFHRIRSNTIWHPPTTQTHTPYSNNQYCWKVVGLCNNCFNPTENRKLHVVAKTRRPKTKSDFMNMKMFTMFHYTKVEHELLNEWALVEVLKPKFQHILVAPSKLLLLLGIRVSWC